MPQTRARSHSQRARPVVDIGMQQVDTGRGLAGTGIQLADIATQMADTEMRLAGTVTLERTTRTQVTQPLALGVRTLH